MIVAGLDMATMTGVAVGPIGGRPHLFSVDLGAGRPHDERFACALRLAKRLITDEGVTHIGIEAPIKAKHDKKATNELLMGIVACVRGWANVKDVPVEVFEVGTIDKHFLGNKMIGREERKRAIVNRCKLLGWTPATDDEADAAAVWETMCSRQSPAYAAQSGSLFRGA